MSQAKSGDTVKVHYTGTLEDGTVFDSSSGGDPLEFTLGEGNVIPGFEHAVDGMNVGDSKNVTIDARDAYGPHMPALMVEVNRDQFPAELEPEVGQQLGLEHPSGPVMPVTITEVTDTKITLDANHPLAGKALNFEIKLVDIG
jgi:peptidylprolyl isomerase